MKVTVVSVFSNATRYLERYFEQMDQLQKLLVEHGDSLSLVLGYGDSGDGTGIALQDKCSNHFDATVLDVSHGGRVYESVVSKRRFKQLAKIGNFLWSKIPKDTNFVLHLESDLIWQGSTLMTLISIISDHSSRVPSLHNHILLAPMIMALNEGKSTFYDTWAFRMSGQHFIADPPYAPASWVGARFWDVDSVGSCFCLDYRLAKQLTWPEEDVVVGLCRQAQELGAKILVCNYLEVYHP